MESTAMTSNNEPTDRSGASSENRPIFSPEEVTRIVGNLKAAVRDGTVNLAPGNTISDPK